jgi:hypothetical protein
MAEFDDDDEFDSSDFEIMPGAWHEIECKPVTKFTFIHFFLTVIIGFLRTLVEATANLGDAVLGAEVFQENKKDFENEVRMSIDMIAEGNEE